jgi:bacillolysin
MECTKRERQAAISERVFPIPAGHLAVGLAVLCGTLCGLTAAAAPAVASDRLAAALGPGVTVARHSETKQVRFIGTSPGRPIRRPAGVPASASPREVARTFLTRNRSAFGISDPGSELRLLAEAGDHGRSTVRFQQVHGGAPILGGELVVNLDQRRNVLSASGEVVASPSLSVRPQVAPGEAAKSALEKVAKQYSIPAEELEVTRPELWIYDARLLGGPGLDRPTLVWRMDVTAGELEPIRELVLVDARLGNVALNFNQIAEAKNRRVCDAASTASQVPCTSPVRVEGGPPSAIVDVNKAYDFSGQTYDFYLTRFARDSLNGAGMALLSTVRYCPSPSNCPYQNAFWNGSQMVYGTGFASADDVVGHELTHGVTEFTSNLFSYYQSGAINESLSDVFGEFVDLTNGAGTDTAATRWQIGEDLPPSVGVIRDMQDPTLLGDPDRMTSPNYTADPSEGDNGGVHPNSGVNNKAAYLMTDGGTFNGRTVTALGITKVARIYYEVETKLLTSASDYADLYRVLPQACTNLIGTVGITAANCVEVKDAALAVEMNQSPPAAPNPEAPVCATGYGPMNSFFDNLENTASGNWTTSATVGSNAWFYPQNPNTIGIDATYATSGKRNFWGYDKPAVADYSIAMAKTITVPTGGFLHFRHAFGFEDDPSGNYDGGIVQYSTNGGGSWTNAGALFTHNGYNGTIFSGFGNPLAGTTGFVRESNGYISSRVNLNSLAAQGIRFRFRIGTDSSADDFGWFIDDVRIYRCLPTIKVNDVSVTEGNAGTKLANFTVTRGTGTGTSSVNYATANGTAVAPGDYTAKSGTLTFSSGQTQQTVGVVVKGDAATEPNETFFLNLSAPSNAVLIDKQGRGTIVNDD